MGSLAHTFWGFLNVSLRASAAQLGLEVENHEITDTDAGSQVTSMMNDEFDLHD